MRKDEGCLMLLSIIIPVYNAQDKISRMLDSLIVNNLPFEIICVNDGSKDESVKVINQYNDPRIKLFSKNNEGTFKAWQYGLHHASGEYVTILDQDDYIDKEYIPYIFHFIKNINADILFTPYYVEKESGEKRIEKIPIHEGLYEGDNLNKIRSKLCNGTVPYAKFSKVIRKEILLYQVSETYKGYIQDFEDWLTIIPIFNKINSLYIKDKPFYHYVQYQNANSGSKSTKSYRKNYESMRNMISYLGDNSFSLICNDNVNSVYFYSSRILLYKCIKIKDFLLADEILKDIRFRRFIRKSNLKSYEKLLLLLRNKRIIYMLYRIKNK